MKAIEIEQAGDKAGIIPYVIENGKLLMMFMIPSDPKYGGPRPQVAKGGIDEGEDVKSTAIREGIEELGLREDNIVNTQFVSKQQITTKSQSYAMTVFAAEVRDRKAFDKPHYETGKVLWLTTELYLQRGRRDQANFVKDLAVMIGMN
jgi:8-oxo-dGTP pyrophosphatase MutT (NUDIX family)